MTEKMTHHEALIFVMVTMSAVDRTMTDPELARIGEIVSNLPAFSDFDQNQLVNAAEACGEVLSLDDGLDQVLLLIRESLPKKLHETAYAIALDQDDVWREPSLLATPSPNERGALLARDLDGLVGGVA